MHMDRPMFVFGSDRAGRHREGAALEALRNRGAVYGQGAGPQGNCYAIPTRCEMARPLRRDEIAHGVATFLDYTRTHPWLLFDVTPIGCDNAGYGPEDIAPMFAGAPHNVTLPRVFADILAAQSSS
ncbi:MAG: hypothetical protein KDJ72_11015 [Methyloceanibacter sp.]|uniref:A1S_2505 family phage non-structural protein n=1 Tax=Methyloceanibacter sp. TaxID=1965321 RepID=UPI001D832281|nr:hypothetical protein [Methyloceanibacter sp.]MCB1443538.1 hypothetical protein [Methyloceanibacter sp.]MCC0058933.1 hypothetical protein [Hyphomicrobiaceae bacterium]